jgi:hypothetical protein
MRAEQIKFDIAMKGLFERMLDLLNATDTDPDSDLTFGDAFKPRKPPSPDNDRPQASA